jgi:cytochrome c oxidase subunit 2
MIGTVTVMEPAHYQSWLSGSLTGESLASAGEKLFQQMGCVTCHRETPGGRGPVLKGVFGKPVALMSGQPVMADEAYIRESVLNPNAKIVGGFPSPSDMPTYQGQISEEGLLQIVAYIKSLATEEKK